MKATSLNHQLGQMVDKPEYSDIEFLVGPEQTPVYASRLVLVARSPVFAAQFMGGFKEALAPSTSTSSSSSSPSAPPEDSSDANKTSVSPQLRPRHDRLPPLFWRSAPLLEVEPTIFRRLLHCCYTDQLPPDDAYSPAAAAGNRDHDTGAPDHHRRARDLVSLHAAADRFLLDHCKELALDELKRTISSANVLTAFDHALAVAPDLANSDLFLPIIRANAAQLLGNTDNDAEAQWLAMSTAGAAAVVACNLSGLREVDLFRAVERWYRHLAEEEHDHRAHQSEAKEQQVARVLKGMHYLLMSADELSDVVEKSGLLSDKQLLVAYKECSLYHRIVLPCALPESTSAPVKLFGPVTIRDGQMVWSAELAKEDGQYIIYVFNEPQREYSAPSGRVSYAGISIRLYLDRECRSKYYSSADETVPVFDCFGLSMGEPPRSTPKQVHVLVHVPAFAMGH